MAEFDERTAALQERLRDAGLDGALVLHPADLLYYAGSRQNGALWVPVAGAAVHWVRRSLARARAESRVADVRPFPLSHELAGLLGAGVRRIGLTLDAVPAAVAAWWGRHPAREVADVSAAVREQRSVKSELDIERMRATARVLCAAFAEVPRFLRPGVRELDLAAELEYRLRRAGSEGATRMRAWNLDLDGGLALAGESAAEPGHFDGAVSGRGLSPASPSGASTRAVREGEPVLLDYTATVDGYVVDMTRIFVCGALPPELERAFGVALAIQGELAPSLRPGSEPAALWERARSLAEEAGLGAIFMGPPGDQVRFVGHGVGLELDELPVLAPGFRAPLAARQTVALEPKFVFPGVGAVGIENTWVVREGGGERLTELADGVVRV